MPNFAQRELLDTFIGEEGIYIDIIREDITLNLGTKILYLERAIQLNCYDFWNFLDKIYNHNLVDEAKIANIELIRAFKLINDFHFNHIIKYNEEHTKATLSHYFGSLGSIDVDEFKIVIQSCINAHIIKLTHGLSEKIAIEKSTRKTDEMILRGQYQWRVALNLLAENECYIPSYIQTGMSQLRMTHYQRSHITNPDCIEAILDGLLTLEWLNKQNISHLTYLTRKLCIEAMRTIPPIFTMTNLENMNLNQLMFIIKPECIDAIKNDETTLETLTEMKICDLHDAVTTGQYSRFCPRF